MRFEHISLTNYRCFEDETVTFEPGVNVIYGLNGSGKSTLLEAAFFALFGSAALREIGSNLEDIVTNEETTAEVALTFTVGDDEYTVSRVLKERGDRVTQTDAVLETPSDIVEGARSVDSQIESMTRMDATAFLNSAFVRQGEINTLVHSSSSERQRLIDRLLQLGKLEEYMDRASDLRVGVGRVRDKKENILDDRKEEVASLREEGVEDELARTRTLIDTRKHQLQVLRDARDDYEDQLDSVEETISEQEGLQESLTEVQESISGVEDRVSELETRRDELVSKRESLSADEETARDEITSFIEDQPVPVATSVNAPVALLREKKQAFSDRRNDARNELTAKKGRVETLEDKRDRLESDYEDTESEIEALEDKKSSKEEELESTLRPELDEIQSEIDEYETRIEELQDTFKEAGVEPSDVDDALQDARDERDSLIAERNSVQADLQAKQEQLDSARELRDEGKCPRCGQDVDGSPHVDEIGDLEETVSELADEITSYETEIEAVEASIDELVELDALGDELADAAASKRAKKQLLEKHEASITDAEASVEEYESQIEEKQAACDELESQIIGVEQEIESVSDDVSVLESRIDVLDNIVSLFDAFREHRETIVELQDSIDSVGGDIEHVDELLSSKTDQLDELQEKQRGIESELDEEALVGARAAADGLETQIEYVVEAISDVEGVLSELQERAGELRGKVGRLSSLEDEITSLEEEVSALDDLYEQMSAVEGMYEELRGDLRQRNIQRLEELLNELFTVTYQNDAYDRIELDGEYNAVMVEKTGGDLSPDKLSGGESVLFNLSLRAAIYQLLVEGIGDSETMPPLILDEPTAHLDEGHVDRIDDLVQRMRDIGVDQTIVVSHTEEIIGSSGHRIEVVQDGTTNRSSAAAETQTLI